MQKLVIFSSGYNCKDYIKKHMLSVQKQTYQNYIHIIVDDASTDGTFDEIMKYKDDKTIVHHNKDNKGWVYNAIKYIKTDSAYDVITIIDLDDWLAHKKVFTGLNDIYEKKKCWVTYGTLVRSTGEVRKNNFNGYNSEELTKKKFETYRWKFWALRTFKSFIWDNIDKKDLLGPDKEYPTTSYDYAIGYPILQMTPAVKIRQIKDISYVYNIRELNDKIVNRNDQIKYCSWYQNRKKYDILKYKDEEKVKGNHFIIFSSGYNCKDYAIKNIESVQNQTYKNYTHIIVDDHSTDDTYEKIMTYKDDKVISYKSAKNRKWLANSIDYLLPNIIDDESIIVVLDLDDWLADNTVLSKLNDIYEKKKCWVTYGSLKYSRLNNPKFLPKNPKQAVKIINRSFRKSKWIYTHLQTFKAFLYMNIDQRDFKDDDKKFIKYSYDRCLMYPILEMTPSNKIRFIKDVLYIYNSENPNNLSKILPEEQSKCKKLIKNKVRYKILKRKK